MKSIVVRALLAFTLVLVTSTAQRAVAQAATDTNGRSSLLIWADTNCDLRLDGQHKGALRPGQMRTFRLAEGQHVLQAINHQKHLLWTRIVHVDAGAQAVAHISFVQLLPQGTAPSNSGPIATPTGTLLLHSNEPCIVTIDGNVNHSLIAGAVDKMPLAVGQHLLTAATSSGGSWSQVVDVRAGEQAVANIDFPRVLAGVTGLQSNAPASEASSAESATASTAMPMSSSAGTAAPAATSPSTSLAGAPASAPAAPVNPQTGVRSQTVGTMAGSPSASNSASARSSTAATERAQPSTTGPTSVTGSEASQAAANVPSNATATAPRINGSTASSATTASPSPPGVSPGASATQAAAQSPGGLNQPPSTTPSNTTSGTSTAVPPANAAGANPSTSVETPQNPSALEWLGQNSIWQYTAVQDRTVQSCPVKQGTSWLLFFDTQNPNDQSVHGALIISERRDAAGACAAPGGVQLRYDNSYDLRIVGNPGGSDFSLTATWVGCRGQCGASANLPKTFSATLKKISDESFEISGGIATAPITVRKRKLM